jgi:hypothetical protein
MPNRKTFNDRDKYDHSSHSTANPEKGDLAPTPDAEPESELPSRDHRIGSDSTSLGDPKSCRAARNPLRSAP